MTSLSVANGAPTCLQGNSCWSTFSFSHLFREVPPSWSCPTNDRKLPKIFAPRNTSGNQFNGMVAQVSLWGLKGGGICLFLVQMGRFRFWHCKNKAKVLRAFDKKLHIPSTYLDASKNGVLVEFTARNPRNPSNGQTWTVSGLHLKLAKG